MNCYNHIESPAVGQCVDCGKGLCQACSSLYKPVLCTGCFLTRKKRAMWRNALSILSMLALFLVGYFANLQITGESNHWVDGFLLMGTVAGWKFLNKIIPFHLTNATIPMWLVYYLVKLVLSVLVGVFVAPIVFVWSIVKLVIEIRRYRIGTLSGKVAADLGSDEIQQE